MKVIFLRSSRKVGHHHFGRYIIFLGKLSVVFGNYGKVLGYGKLYAKVYAQEYGKTQNFTPSFRNVGHSHFGTKGTLFVSSVGTSLVPFQKSRGHIGKTVIIIPKRKVRGRCYGLYGNFLSAGSFVLNTPDAILHAVLNTKLSEHTPAGVWNFSLINLLFICNKSGMKSFRYANHYHREKKVQGKIPPLQATLGADFLLFPFCNGLFCLAFPAVLRFPARRFYLHSADRNGGHSRNEYHIFRNEIIWNCIISIWRSYLFRKEGHYHIGRSIITFPLKAVSCLIFGCRISG